MTPYYDHAGIQIFHGDCRDVLEEWEGLRTQSFDLLLTDPPYGIGEARGKNASRGQLAQATDWGISDWDDIPQVEGVARARAVSRYHIIFGGNYYTLPPTSCWLVWDKDNGDTDFSDCELAWTNLRKAVRKLTYRWNGMLQAPGCPKELRLHPTIKPEPVMRWALMQAPPGVRTVLDPFMGSGTTLVAAKRLGRQCVGIEREERYCEVAAKRLAQDVLPFADDTVANERTQMPLSLVE
jgi:DNA modification methylase